jgi:hypothetical protein
MSHARAVQLLSSEEVKSKYIVVIGINLEVGHGVLKSDIDARVTSLSSRAIFTWLWKYEHDDDVRCYVETFYRCCPRHSIVHSLICAALEGRTGDYLPEHLRARITKSVVQLSEETCVSIGYHFDDVIRDNVYFKRLTPESNLNQVYDIIFSTKGNRLSNLETSSTPRSISLAHNSWFSHLMQYVGSAENKPLPSGKKKT